MHLLLTGSHHNKGLQADFNTYGINGFTFDAIPCATTERHDLLELEQKTINSYKADGKQIYNRHDPILRYHRIPDVSRFVSYINSKWLVPSNCILKSAKQYRIWREEDKREIIQECIDCKMLEVPDRLVTFNSVVWLLEDCLGYVVDSGRFMQEKQRHTYKIVLDYCEEKNTYVDAHPVENDDVTTSGAAVAASELY